MSVTRLSLLSRVSCLHAFVCMPRCWTSISPLSTSSQRVACSTQPATRQNNFLCLSELTVADQKKQQKIYVGIIPVLNCTRTPSFNFGSFVVSEQLRGRKWRYQSLTQEATRPISWSWRHEILSALRNSTHYDTHGINISDETENWVQEM